MIKRVDENGNVRLITNIRKPRKWRRYEYLESSGTLWIDTGIKLSLTDKFEFETDFTYSPANGRACPFYGTENYLTGFMALYHYTNNNLYPLWIKGANYGGSNIATNAESRMYSKTAIDVPNKAWAITYNTTSANGTYSNLITDTTSTVKFFGNDLYNKYVAKCYYFKIIKNGTLIKHFVPAQYNGQYGMWDLVEDRFYPNKGTGSFTVGPEMKNYDEINEVKKAYSILPSGVELYDYILSSGTLYIDSNWYIDYDKNFIIKAEYMGSTSGTRGCILSSYNSSKFISYEYTTGPRMDIYGANVDVTKAVTHDTKHNSFIEYNNGVLTHTVDGTVHTTLNKDYTGLCDKSAYIFLDREKRSSTFNKVFKIYYLTIIENNETVRNFLPCTYLGEPGMWDTVENKFYRNQGTGLFTLGSKITLKEYEYLESSKTQWIDSNFYPNLDSGSELKVQILPSSEAYSKLLYTDYTSTNEGSILWGWDINNSNRFRAAYYKDLKIIMGKVGKINNNDVYLLRIDKNIYSINGITVLTNSTINFLSSSTVKLFARKNLNGSITNQSAMRLYYCKFYNDNQLVRDFIPVSYNGTPGLWDKVEWKFYGNAGSGSFTLGPEKASGIYPVWTPIEYLLSTGTLYINTDYKTSSLIVVYKWGAIDINTDSANSLFGSERDSSPKYSGVLYGGKTSRTLWIGSSTSLAINYNSNDNNKHDWELNINLGIVSLHKDSNLIKSLSYSGQLQDTVSIGIFCNNGRGLKSKLSLYYFLIYDNNVLVLDFIPVRIGNIGYLFDKVTGKMFGNSGTGNFILGPDINL